MLQRRKSVAARGPQGQSVGGRRVAVMVMLMGLAACGQKGPLTLGKPMPSASAASAAAPR